jgi:hypothetical protein
MIVFSTTYVCVSKWKIYDDDEAHKTHHEHHGYWLWQSQKIMADFQFLFDTKLTSNFILGMTSLFYHLIFFVLNLYHAESHANTFDHMSWILQDLFILTAIMLGWKAFLNLLFIQSTTTPMVGTPHENKILAGPYLSRQINDFPWDKTNQVKQLYFLAGSLIS